MKIMLTNDGVPFEVTAVRSMAQDEERKRLFRSAQYAHPGEVERLAPALAKKYAIGHRPSVPVDLVPRLIPLVFGPGAPGRKRYRPEGGEVDPALDYGFHTPAQDALVAARKKGLLAEIADQKRARGY